MNVGIIGVGYWGPNLVRVFSGFASIGKIEICDLNNNNLNKIRKMFPDIKVYNDYYFILNNPEIDAVVIATPAATHFEIGKKALMHGKHVFIEKPLALSVKECEELVAIAENKKRILMVGHTFLYNSAVRFLKEYIDTGEMGSLYYIYSQRLNLGRVRNDINAMWNFAPHDISIILYLIGQSPVAVDARGFSYLQEGIEDVVFITLYFPEKRCAHIHVSWLDPNKVRRMTIVGQNKMAVYDDVLIDEKIKIFDKGISRKNISESLGGAVDFGEFQLIQRAGDVFIPKLEFQEPLKAEASHFIECIEKKTVPLTDGLHGLEVVKILECAQRSLKNNGIPEAIK